MSDTNVHRVVGNLLVGTSHFFVDTTTNQVGINTSSPSASLDVATGDVKVGSGITLASSTGIITATGGFSGDGSLLENVAGDSGSWVNGTNSNVHLSTSTNKVGIATTNPDAGLHVNSNAYVHTDFRVGTGIAMNVTSGRITAGSFEGDGSLLRNVPGSPGGWKIIMRTSGKKNQYTSAMYTSFGNPGSGTFRSITASSTGASSRTSFGDAVGLYDAFFTKTGITKIALVSGNGNMSDMTSHTQYIIYNLVESTGAESLYDIIKRLDQYNQNNTSWAGNNFDNLYHASSVTNFTAGTNGYSGTRSGSSSSGILTEAGHAQVPDKFCIWGINQDSDNDTQVLCAYSGTLASGNGKGDSWRGGQPKHSFWSYWGNDWHSNSVVQTIGAASQSNPGIGDSVNTYVTDIYLMAF